MSQYALGCSYIKLKPFTYIIHFSDTYTEIVCPVLDVGSGYNLNPLIFPAIDWVSLNRSFSDGSLPSGSSYTVVTVVSEMYLVLYDRRDLFYTYLETFVFETDITRIEETFSTVFLSQSGNGLVAITSVYCMNNLGGGFI